MLLNATSPSSSAIAATRHALQRRISIPGLFLSTPLFPIFSPAKLEQSAKSAMGHDRPQRRSTSIALHVEEFGAMSTRNLSSSIVSCCENVGKNSRHAAEPDGQFAESRSRSEDARILQSRI